MEILDFNHCHSKIICDCGWNIQLGGKSEVELMRLKKFLKDNNFIENDLTDYSQKIRNREILMIDWYEPNKTKIRYKIEIPCPLSEVAKIILIKKDNTKLVWKGEYERKTPKG